MSSSGINMPSRSIGLFVVVAISEIIRLKLDALSGEMTSTLAINAGAIILYSIMMSAVIGWLASRSSWSRLHLFVALFVALYAVQFLQAFIEVLYFQSMMPFSSDDIVNGVYLHAITAVLVAGGGVLFFGGVFVSDGKFQKFSNDAGAISWILRFLAAGVIYAVFYFLAGAFIVLPHEFAQEFYDYAQDVNPLSLFGFQIFRGMIWAGIAVMLLASQSGSAWERLLALGTAFSVFLIVLLLPENPHMPPELRLVHIVEIGASNFLFGVCGGAVLLRLVRL